jgi:hypothetical protein
MKPGGNMLSTVNKVVHKAFGFNVMSEVPLPELPNVSEKVNQVDIVIELKDLTDLWNEISEPNRYFSVKENSVIFQVPNTATYYIENGNKILVSPMDGSQEDHIRLYVLGTCMGAILLQRKILPLHGSAIAINGKAYAIVGDSGAGKSTLASAFLNKGYQLLSDDVIPVSLSSDNIPIVTPAYPQQKLWQESLQAFGMEANEYRPIFDRETKFAIPVTSQFSSESLPLAGVFELVKSDNSEIKLNPILNLTRLHTLFYHTYRNFLIARLGLMEWHFQMTASIANQIQVYQIQRPIDRFTANDLASLILDTINKE